MKQSGFTLIEILVVIAMVGILSAMAMSGYKTAVLGADESLAQKEIFELANRLEKHQSNNFSYKDFATTTLTSPQGATGSKIKYNLHIVDGSGSNPTLTSTSAIGRSYIIKAVSVNNRSYTLLYNSDGLRCKNKSSARVSYQNCGTTLNGAEDW